MPSLSRTLSANATAVVLYKCYYCYYYCKAFFVVAGLHFYLFYILLCFPFSALTLLVGWQKWHPVVKKLGVVCWWQRFGWSFPRLISSSCHHHPHHPWSKNIQNSGILIPAYPGSCRKWPLNRVLTSLLYCAVFSLQCPDSNCTVKPDWWHFYLQHKKTFKYIWN